MQGISRPRAATSVQTKIAVSLKTDLSSTPLLLASIWFTAFLNLSKFLILCLCYIFECRGQFLIYKKSSKLVSLLTVVIALQKTIIDCPFFS